MFYNLGACLCLAPEAEETGFSPTCSEKTNTGFPMTWLTCDCVRLSAHKI